MSGAWPEPLSKVIVLAPALRGTGTLTVSTVPQSPVEGNVWRVASPPFAEISTGRASPLT